MERELTDLLSFEQFNVYRTKELTTLTDYPLPEEESEWTLRGIGKRARNLSSIRPHCRDLLIEICVIVCGIVCSVRFFSLSFNNASRNFFLAQMLLSAEQYYGRQKKAKSLVNPDKRVVVCLFCRIIPMLSGLSGGRADIKHTARKNNLLL